MGADSSSGRPARAGATALGRRTLIVVAIALLVAIPAGVLRAMCVGKSCREPPTAARVPFCSLRADLRAGIVDGFREGRSADVLAVTSGLGVTGSSTGMGTAWPSTESDVGADGEVAFWGTGVNPATVSEVVRLDAVAPTIAEIIGLERPHPEVRSGTALDGLASGESPRLVVEIVLEEESELPSSLVPQDAATGPARAGSQPGDPAALMTTIGTGGLPSQHGITGGLIRTDDGKLVRAWGRRAPVSVIATLPDDLDEQTSQRARIGVISPHRRAVGLIGGNWYGRNDADDLSIGPGDISERAVSVLNSGYGRDDVTDFLAVAVSDTAGLDRVVAAARRVSEGSVTIVAVAAGARAATSTSMHWRDVERHVNKRLGTDVVEAVALGGLFVDQKTLARKELPQDDVVRALSSVRSNGRPVFSDVFSAVTVTLSRYC